MRSVIADSRRLVVKVGSSLVTNDGRGLDHEAIGRWAAQIAALAQTWGHEPHCDTRYGTCCATGQLEALLFEVTP